MRRFQADHTALMQRLASAQPHLERLTCLDAARELVTLGLEAIHPSLRLDLAQSVIDELDKEREASDADRI